MRATPPNLVCTPPSTRLGNVTPPGLPVQPCGWEVLQADRPIPNADELDIEDIIRRFDDLGIRYDDIHARCYARCPPHLFVADTHLSLCAHLPTLFLCSTNFTNTFLGLKLTPLKAFPNEISLPRHTRNCVAHEPVRDPPRNRCPSCHSWKLPGPVSANLSESKFIVFPCNCPL